jgi:hypothetical protein
VSVGLAESIAHGTVEGVASLGTIKGDDGDAIVDLQPQWLAFRHVGFLSWLIADVRAPSTSLLSSRIGLLYV